MAEAAAAAVRQLGAPPSALQALPTTLQKSVYGFAELASLMLTH